MVLESWPSSDHRYGCSCARCLREQRLIERRAHASLSTALRHAQNRVETDGVDFAAGPPKPPPAVTIPPIRLDLGKGVSIAELKKLHEARKPGQPIVVPGWQPNAKGLYVYRVPSLFRKRPLYIGETRPQSQNTIPQRILQEINGKGADKSDTFKKLAAFLNGEPVQLIDGGKMVSARPDQIFVHPAKIVVPPRFPIDFSTDPSQHGVELLLKGAMNPILGKGSLTFENADASAEGPADLVERLAELSVRALRESE
jgi:hypothetical protein